MEGLELRWSDGMVDYYHVKGTGFFVTLDQKAKTCREMVQWYFSDDVNSCEVSFEEIWDKFPEEVQTEMVFHLETLRHAR